MLGSVDDAGSAKDSRWRPQPQLLAVLCLMRSEDWTFRAAAVRLAEHQELRGVLGLHGVPDYTTLSRLLRRLDAAVLEQTFITTGPGYPF